MRELPVGVDPPMHDCTQLEPETDRTSTFFSIPLKTSKQWSCQFLSAYDKRDHRGTAVGDEDTRINVLWLAGNLGSLAFRGL